MDEESRALAYRLQAVRRQATEQARWVGLRGNPSRFLALWNHWAPWLPLDRFGVPRQGDDSDGPAGQAGTGR